MPGKWPMSDEERRRREIERAAERVEWHPISSPSPEMQALISALEAKVSDEYLLKLGREGNAPAKLAGGGGLKIEDIASVLKVVTFDEAALNLRRR